MHLYCTMHMYMHVLCITLLQPTVVDVPQIIYILLHGVINAHLYCSVQQQHNLWVSNHTQVLKNHGSDMKLSST